MKLFNWYLILILTATVAYSCDSINTFKNKHLKSDVCNSVEATMQTDPVDSEGDAMDDPAVWIHPDDPSKSLIIGTNKKAGLIIYDLDGKQCQFVQSGRVNNVDIRYGFNLGEEKIDIVAASNRSFNTLSIYKIDGDSCRLTDVSARAIKSDLSEVYGFCLYKSAVSGKFFAFVNSKDGSMEQWELFGTEDKKIDAKKVRSFEVGKQTEGCVADDELGYLYVGEETFGIWKFFAEPDKNTDRKLVADTTASNIVSDIEGLTIYYTEKGKGYLLASIQGDNSYAVFERDGKNKYLGCFSIVDGSSTDGVKETDGIDVVNLRLNNKFPNGFFIAQDGYNSENGRDTTQNFKMVPWENIANSFSSPLIIDNQFNVRRLSQTED